MTAATEDGIAPPDKAAIDLVDFAAIRQRLTRSGGFEDWRADRAVVMYRTFLEMCADNPGRELAPPRDADTAWHHHILDTRAYPRDCQRIFGRVLHHDPDIHGSPRFWSAWDRTRVEFRRRLGLDLPGRDAVPADPGLTPETCSASHAGCDGPQTEAGMIGRGDAGLEPHTCSVVSGLHTP